MGTKIAFVSLGCDKNTVDSEIMIEMLSDRGFQIVKDDAQAEVIVVNTCGFIQDAQEESINTLIELGKYKENGQLKYLIAAGCLAQRFAQEIRESLPEVDAVVGTGSYERICEVIEDLLQEEKNLPAQENNVLSGNEDQEQNDHYFYLDPIEQRDLGYRKRLPLTPGYYGYAKIAEGCDNCCTYCAIPKLRGPYRSRKMEDVLAEVRDMTQEGVQEVIVIAQDITKYGQDLYGYKALPELLKKIASIDEVHWIRLLYCYPEDITDELIETIATEPKIVHYVDMPIQHCSDAVLKRMGRHHDKARLLEVIGKLRSRIPDIALRTTLITGFPGETEQQFEEMCDFVSEMKFDRLGVFAYSQEEGTPAGRMKEQIDPEIKEARKDRLMAIQQQISAEKGSSMVGKELEVIVEGLVPDDGENEDGKSVYVTRTFRDAPDIDGFLFLQTDGTHLSGEFVQANVLGAYEYDLFGSEIIKKTREE